MSRCCKECSGNKSGNFTYIRFASDSNGSDISLLRNAGGVERCYQAIITSGVALDESSPEFANYFVDKWFNICEGNSSSNSCCCMKFGYQTPTSTQNTWRFTGDAISYDNDNGFINLLKFQLIEDGQKFYIPNIKDNNGNNLQNNKSYYLKLDYDFSGLNSGDVVTISLGDGSSATKISFEKSSGAGVREVLLDAVSGSNFDASSLVISVETSGGVSGDGNIFNFEFGTEKCFTGSSDNKWKMMNFGGAYTAWGGESIEVIVANAINNMYNPTNESDPNYNSNVVAEDEIHAFAGIVYPLDRSPITFRMVFVANGYGKGKYGQNGDLTVAPQSLRLIEKEQLTFWTLPPLIESDPNSNLEDLGEIPDGDFISVINSANPNYDIDANTNWYFTFTVNGLSYYYAFIGDEGLYGQGQTPATTDDFFLLEYEGNPTEQDNVAKVIYVYPSNLSSYSGTTKEKIAQYINDQQIIKLDTDSEIWIEYDDTTISLTGFQVDPDTLTQNCCNVPAGSNYSLTLYHDGSGQYPVEGDQIYMDEAGTIPYNLDSEVRVDDGRRLFTDHMGEICDCF